MDFGDRWSLTLAGDVGGTSTSDQYSAEAFGLVGYRFSLFGKNNANFLAGYRVLRQKYEDGDGRSAFEWDMTIHGPIAGLKIGFEHANPRDGCLIALAKQAQNPTRC